jgi:lysophospholipase L1-like esterase
MLRTEQAETVKPAEKKVGEWKWLLLLLAAVLVIAFNRRLIPGVQWDWLNVIPAVAALYIGYCVVALKKTCGRIPWVARCLSEDPEARKPRGAFPLSPPVRSLLLMVVAVVVVEFALRCFSYQRALVYERHGDLLFTPVPNQTYVEKISLTPSHINRYGLRGGPVPASATQEGQPTVVCLGDSVTYGYGVDDGNTYPADLQRDLDGVFPGRFVVLNAGVDAYPAALIDQKFLYLWKLGLRPKAAIVGYSFNEGGLGVLMANSDEETKRKFEMRVRLKNHLRSFALYTLIVEKWARHYYDRAKPLLIPGTNFTNVSQTEAVTLYQHYLESLVGHLRARGVQPIFLLFCGYDSHTARYDDQGAFQLAFAEFAEKNGVPLLRTEQALQEGEPPNADLRAYFIDHAHLNDRGTAKVAAALSRFLPQVLGYSPAAP